MSPPHLPIPYLSTNQAKVSTTVQFVFLSKVCSEDQITLGQGEQAMPTSSLTFLWLLLAVQ